MTAGTNTLQKTKQQAEITNISPFGIWLLSNGKEYFIDGGAGYHRSGGAVTL